MPSHISLKILQQSYGILETFEKVKVRKQMDPFVSLKFFGCYIWGHHSTTTAIISLFEANA